MGQNAYGELGERVLDSFFSKWFSVEPVSMEWQWRGIDRFFSCDGSRMGVQYKTDSQAGGTGNIFIEVWSNVESGRLGWAHTSEADKLAYLIPSSRLIYWSTMGFIRESLSVWGKLYPIKEAANEHYHSRGILVPVRTFAAGAARYDLPADICHAERQLADYA
jgi:hypothetical protein